MRLLRLLLALSIALGAFGPGHEALAQVVGQSAAPQPVAALPAGLGLGNGLGSGLSQSQTISLGAVSLGPGVLPKTSLIQPQAPALQPPAAAAATASAPQATSAQGPKAQAPQAPAAASASAQAKLAPASPASLVLPLQSPGAARVAAASASPARQAQAGVSPQGDGAAAAKVLDAARTAQAETAKALAVPGTSREGSRSASALLFEGRGAAGAAVSDAPVQTSGALGQGRAPLSAGLRPASEAAAEEGKGLAGKTLLYIVSRVGGRDYLYENMVRLSEKYGFELVVLGYPDQKDFAVSKGIKPGNYVSADIGNHSEENIRAIVAQVKELARGRRIDAVKTYLNAYALVDAELSHALGLPGYSPEAVRGAHTKSLARRLMNAYQDESIHLPAFEARSAAEAREAFLKIKAAGYDKVVAKPDSGGGGWGVTLGLDSPEAAEKAYLDIQGQIEELVRHDPRKARSKQVDQKPLVLFEAQIPDGLMLDVEVILRDGRPTFAFLSYNPPALGNQERGTTYPARLTPEMEALARSQALKSLDAVGLKNGNAHVEVILTLVKGKLAGPIVEINARMGGADIWASIKESAGVDVMEEGLFAAFAKESKPSPRPEPVLLQHRFLLAKTAGRLAAVRGLPKTGGDVFLSEMFLKEGEELHENDLLGNITVRGKDEAAARDRLFELLKGVEIDIRTPDGRLVTQDGLYGHDSDAGRTLSEDWVDRIEFQRAGWLGRIKSLPKSFLWGFTPAWTINAMAQELQAVALPLYSAALFGLPAALAITGLGYLTRIAGAWTGSFFMSRFDPKWVNVAAILALALAGVPIPVAAALGASSSTLFAVFLANSVVGGLVYGINRGIAESLLPRMMIGSSNPDKLELGLNYAYQWVEISCIGMALLAAVPLLNLIGGNALMAVSSAGIALSAVLYSTLKFREPFRKPEPRAARPAPEPATAQESPLGLKDYLPFAFLRFMHFMTYGVLATVFALSVFASPGAAGNLIGLYDGGSWLASLLATLALLPEGKLDRKGWALLAGVAATAFVWSALLHVPALTYALGGVLGGLVTINTNKWMAYYSQKLPQDKYRDLSKWMMTASILAMLPIFAAVSAARVFPALGAVLALSNVLLGLNVAVTLAAAVMAALLLKKG